MLKGLFPLISQLTYREMNGVTSMKLNICCISAFVCSVLLTGCQGFSVLPSLNFLSSRESYEEMQDPFIAQSADSSAGRLVVDSLSTDEVDPSLPGPRPIERVAFAEGTGVPGTGIAHAVYPDAAATAAAADSNEPRVIQSIEGRGLSSFLQGQPVSAARTPAVSDSSAASARPTSALERMETPLNRRGRLSPAAEAAVMDSRAAEIDDFNLFLDEEAAAELPPPAKQRPPQASDLTDNPFSQLDGFPVGDAETQQVQSAPSFDSQFGDPADWRPAATRP